MQHPEGIEAKELAGQEAAEALSCGLELVAIPADLGRAEFERVLGKAPAIPSRIAKSIAWFAPPSSSVHAQVAHDEAAAVRADLAYNEMKNSGELRRREADRAQAEERRWGVV